MGSPATHPYQYNWLNTHHFTSSKPEYNRCIYICGPAVDVLFRLILFFSGMVIETNRSSLGLERIPSKSGCVWALAQGLILALLLESASITESLVRIRQP